MEVTENVLNEIKSLLDPKLVLKHDQYINTSVPLLIEFAQEDCNNSFTDEFGVLSLKGGMKLFLAKCIEYNLNSKAGQSSRTFGEVSYSYDTNFPPSILKFLEPYRRIKV
jgi:Phage gp6-like head-tail connector protein